jgi:hypothetical protein
MTSVDDAVGRPCGGAQAVQVVDVTAEELRPGTGERIGARSCAPPRDGLR